MAAEKPHHGDGGRLSRKPQGIVPFQRRIAVFRDTHFVGIEIHLLAPRHLNRLKLLTQASNSRGIVGIFLLCQPAQSGEQRLMFLFRYNRRLTLADNRPGPPAFRQPRLPHQIEQMPGIG